MLLSLDADTTGLAVCISVAQVSLQGQIVWAFRCRLDLLKLHCVEVGLSVSLLFFVSLFSKMELYKELASSFSLIRISGIQLPQEDSEGGERSLYLGLLFHWLFRFGPSALGTAEFPNTSRTQRPTLWSTNKIRKRMWNLFAGILKSQWITLNGNDFFPPPFDLQMIALYSCRALACVVACDPVTWETLIPSRGSGLVRSGTKR